MEIYILRHAPAVKRGTAGYPDDNRPLTKTGVRKMRLAARGIRKVIPEVDLILSSPLSRAAETARLAAKALGHRHKILTCEELLPQRGTEDVLRCLTKFNQTSRLLLVGHEPGLSLLASAFLGSNSPIIELKKGSLCRIDCSELPLKEPGKLRWHLTPKQLRDLSFS